MLKKESPKKKTPKKKVTVKTYLEADVDHNHVQSQGCYCGKHLPESSAQQQASQVKTQKRVSQPPQPPKALYQRGRHPFHKKPELPQTPDLPRYAQPVKLIRKQEHYQPQAQKPDTKQGAKLKFQNKPQQKLQLPKIPTQNQLRRYRLEQFYAECANPLETQEQLQSGIQYPYTLHQVERGEDQGKLPLEKDRLAHKKDSSDLPQKPVAAYRGWQPFDGDVQMSTSGIQPPQMRPQQQTWKSN